jgi:hypothetical protein
MGTKLRNWVLKGMAAAAIPAALAIVPAAASPASAAVARPTAAVAKAATTGIWINLQAYTGTYPTDALACVLGYENYWSHVYPLTPISDFRCFGQLYSPNLGHYYELQVFVS